MPAGYQGIAAGKLLRQWQSGPAQRSFHYLTSAPIRNLPAVIAVPWQPQQAQVAGVDLAIYSPYYNAATDLTWQALRQTMDWFTQQIGTLPGESLKLVMAPDIGASGYALPQLVLINHRLGLRAMPAPGAGFSQVYRRAVHEMAHQWFGHGIGNGVPGDGTLLIEALARILPNWCCWNNTMAAPPCKHWSTMNGNASCAHMPIAPANWKTCWMPLKAMINIHVPPWCLPACALNWGMP